VTEVARERRQAPWRWAVWSLRTPALLVIAAVDAAALTCLGVVLASSWEPGDLGVAAALLLCAVIGTEGARHVERRRRSSGTLHKDLRPVWVLAAVLLLSLPVALLFTVVQATWWRVRTGRCTPYRWFFSTAVSLLGVVAAHHVGDGGVRLLAHTGLTAPDALGVSMVLAALAYLLTDVLLCAVAIYTLEPGSSARDAFGGPAEWAVDAVAGGLACVVATASLVSPWLVFLAVPVTMTAQRALLLRQLETEISIDKKTEVASFPWWRQRAEYLLHRVASRHDRMAILFVDIDHFRAVNTAYGHLVGDHALRAVAATMRSLTRKRDIVGRFGGEEFVIALPGVTMAEAFDVAHRIRTTIAATPLTVSVNGAESDTVEVRLTVSIGLASYPETGQTLDELLEMADRALYTAKSAGRNRVVRADMAFSTVPQRSGGLSLDKALNNT
jgi:diguanylate cyclase (GGDEF)-like protein